MRMEPGTEPCGSGLIIHTKYHLIVLASTRLTQMVRFLHVNSNETHCVMPMTDVFEHVLGSAVVAVCTRFITYRRADGISTKAGLQCLLWSQIKPKQTTSKQGCMEGKNFWFTLPWRRRCNADMCAAFALRAFLSPLSLLIHLQASWHRDRNSRNYTSSTSLTTCSSSDWEDSL